MNICNIWYCLYSRFKALLSRFFKTLIIYPKINYARFTYFIQEEYTPLNTMYAMETIIYKLETGQPEQETRTGTAPARSGFTSHRWSRTETARESENLETERTCRPYWNICQQEEYRNIIYWNILPIGKAPLRRNERKQDGEQITGTQAPSPNIGI